MHNQNFLLLHSMKNNNRGSAGRMTVKLEMSKAYD